MKTCLIVEGGGMKCAYSAGILDRFIDDKITFDECIGVSAGSGNIASYLAGQRGRNLRFYVDHPKDSRYHGIKQWILTGSLFNLKFIYGTLSNEDGADPLDYDALMQNPSEFLITTTEVKTGEAKYFPKSSLKRNDLSVIMAGAAIPAMSRPVKIDGIKYLDGGVADSIPLKKALDDGCDKIVLILANPRSFCRQPQDYKVLYHMMLLRYPKIVKGIDTRHLRYRECLKWVYEMEKGGKIFIFAPPENTGIATSTIDFPLLQKLYETGVADYNAEKEKMIAYLSR